MSRMSRLWSFLVVLVIQLHCVVHGYMIDQDCGGQCNALAMFINLLTLASDDRQFVQNRVDAAFRLIENSVTEMNRSPINTQIDDLYYTLLGRRFGAQSTVKTNFENLLRLRNRNDNDQTSHTQNGQIDFRFYCTVKRIEKRGDRYWNKDRNMVYKLDEITSPGGRFANCMDLTSPALMITFTNTEFKYSEIQICPWFLSKVRGYKFKDLSSLPSAVFSLVARVAVPIAARVMYTPIDSFSLMDKTLVHEMTHTDQFSPPTIDVEGDPYGFMNAQRVAADWVRDNSKPDPMRNADNYSLFAVGTWIIAKGGGPINPDGTFRAPQSTPKPRI
ncbi:hypothetical protein FB567DRAFT_544185 [Paraphoma chrysanthemicola]|uniref:Lysine-specific metallo-endopeptidase domain-containing protein n=1 Tax=Paraphoma chrysanthemicola TaxID=798071 RepID=A0A8K0RK13_9PLEO|nr:hypothetical protein FB567DRAFT_544185 [Paraphoma chrysanthemicola]